MTKIVVTLILLAIYFSILLIIRIIKKIDYKKIKKQEDLEIADWIIDHRQQQCRIPIELLQEYGIIEEFIYIFNENHINVKSIKYKLNKYKEEE